MLATENHKENYYNPYGQKSSPKKQQPTLWIMVDGALKTDQFIHFLIKIDNWWLVARPDWFSNQTLVKFQGYTSEGK